MNEKFTDLHEHGYAIFEQIDEHEHSHAVVTFNPEHGQPGHVHNTQCHHTEQTASEEASKLFHSVENPPHGEAGHTHSLTCEHHEHEATAHADSLFHEHKNPSHGEIGHVHTSECEHTESEAAAVASLLDKHSHNQNPEHGQPGHVHDTQCHHSEEQAAERAKELFDSSENESKLEQSSQHAARISQALAGNGLSESSTNENIHNSAVASKETSKNPPVKEVAKTTDQSKIEAKEQPSQPPEKVIDIHHSKKDTLLKETPVKLGLTETVAAKNPSVKTDRVKKVKDVIKNILNPAAENIRIDTAPEVVPRKVVDAAEYPQNQNDSLVIQKSIIPEQKITSPPTATESPIAPDEPLFLSTKPLEPAEQTPDSELNYKLPEHRAESVTTFDQDNTKDTSDDEEASYEADRVIETTPYSFEDTNSENASDRTGGAELAHSYLTDNYAQDDPPSFFRNEPLTFYPATEARIQPEDTVSFDELSKHINKDQVITTITLLKETVSELERYEEIPPAELGKLITSAEQLAEQLGISARVLIKMLGLDVAHPIVTEQLFETLEALEKLLHEEYRYEFLTFISHHHSKQASSTRLSLRMGHTLLQFVMSLSQSVESNLQLRQPTHQAA